MNTKPRTSAGIFACAVAGLLIFAVCVAMSPIPTSEIEIYVVDDRGIPVAGVSVGAGSTNPKDDQTGVTDKNGEFVYRARIPGALACSAKKTGYYKTQGELWDGPSSAGLLPPTNRYQVVIKRIINPVPMVEKDISLEVPKNGEPAGFDFEVGDWVAPRGKGKWADCLISGTRRFVSPDDMDISATILFTNKSEGIQVLESDSFLPCVARSSLPPPAYAPVDGYKETLTWEISRHPEGFFKTSQKDGIGYLIKTRSVRGPDEQSQTACYGWIKGQVAVGGYDSKAATIRLRYFYNPDPTSRSLEPESIARWQNLPPEKD